MRVASSSEKAAVSRGFFFIPVYFELVSACHAELCVLCVQQRQGLAELCVLCAAAATRWRVRSPLSACRRAAQKYEQIIIFLTKC